MPPGGRRAGVWRGERALLYLLPSLVFLAVFTYIPMLRALATSVLAWNVAHPQPVFVGLRNYQQLLTEPVFRLVVRNTFLFAAVGIPVTIGLGLFLAVLLNERLGVLRAVYRAAVFYPTMLPMAAAAMLWVWLLNPGIGLVNYYLGKLGVPRIEWLYDMNWALPAIMVTWIWKNVGYLTILYLAGLQAIPSDLLEAASVEGAGFWQRFRHVTWPLLGPTTVFVVVVSVINSFQIFDAVHIMTQGGPADRTNVLVYYVYQQAFRFWDIGVASALTVLFVGFLLLLILVAVRRMEQAVFYEV
ncbi:MAG: sugar ABC transporter permease [Armatimonadota bacterium]|nr:sugar ABC transporter permease [Armatimonadota bacterium]